MINPDTDRSRRLDLIQHAAFRYFLDFSDPDTGLVADTSLPGSPCSIAVVGFWLSCMPIGVERGWMTRVDAVARTRSILDFFLNSEQSDAPNATGYRGFYYHFLDMRTGRRTWDSELSSIDTAFLIAGMITASAYFQGDTQSERDIRQVVTLLYERVDWRFMENESAMVFMGWKPETGFLPHVWQGYSEAIILFVLGLASPTFALSKDSYAQFTNSYTYLGEGAMRYLHAGPLFIHLFSHSWIDFRGLQDGQLDLDGTDYFQNTQRAITAQQAYAEQNPDHFTGYGARSWGLSACCGPKGPRTLRDGRRMTMKGYSARAVPFGPDDGTLIPWAGLACLPFNADAAWQHFDHLVQTYPALLNHGRFPDSFNPSLRGRSRGPEGWVARRCSGLDQGLLVMMTENYRTGQPWALMRSTDLVRRGLDLAGFTGGWLDCL